MYPISANLVQPSIRYNQNIFVKFSLWYNLRNVPVFTSNIFVHDLRDSKNSEIRKMAVFFGVVVFVGLSVSTLEHGLALYRTTKVGKEVTRIITRVSGTGDSPRGKLHYDAYVSLQSGCAGRKAYYASR